MQKLLGKYKKGKTKINNKGLMMKKYLLIWDKKLQQMFHIYVNGGWNVSIEDIKAKLLERSDIDLNDVDRYITFDSDSATIYPYYHKVKMEKK